MKTPEKLIPKAKLLRALHEIVGVAREPEKHVAAHGILATGTDSHAYALGWIEAAARDALGVEAPTTGWLAGAGASAPKPLRGPSDEGTGAANPDAAVVIV